MARTWHLLDLKRSKRFRSVGERRIVLHVGSHKTATTQIQKWLLSNSDVLSERGFDYPNLRLLNEKAVDFTQWDMFAAIAGGEESSRLGKGGLAPVLDRLASSKAHTILLSAENCWGLPPKDRESNYFALKSSFARDVVDTVKQYTGRDVQVVAWVRRPDQYLISLFNQTIKQLPWAAPTQDLGSAFWHFVSENEHLVQYDRQLKSWLEASNGALAVRQFTPRAFVGGSPVTDFAQVVGIDTNVEGMSPAPETRTNESWSATALMVKAEANRHIQSRQESVRIRRLIEREMGSEVFEDDFPSLVGRKPIIRLQEQLLNELDWTLGQLDYPEEWLQPWLVPDRDEESDLIHRVVRLAAVLAVRNVSGKVEAS